MSTAIVTDSTADLSPARARELGIRVVPLTVQVAGVEYQDGVDLSPERFYEKLSGIDSMPTTSQPSIAAFQQIYADIAADDIISIHLSAKLSGTWNNARTAAEGVSDKRIRVIDSGTASMALGYIVQAAAQAATAGEPFESICHTTEYDISRSGFFALLDNLSYAQKSGRITIAQALVASMLQVKPILSLKGGEIVPVDRTRTMRKGMERLVELTARDAPFRYLAVAHANDLQMGLAAADRLRELHNGPVDVVLTGPVIGTHCGPGAIGTCYLTR